MAFAADLDGLDQPTPAKKQRANQEHLCGTHPLPGKHSRELGSAEQER